jgi:hypothetical protein
VEDHLHAALFEQTLEAIHRAEVKGSSCDTIAKVMAVDPPADRTDNPRRIGMRAARRLREEIIQAVEHPASHQLAHKGIAVA